MRLNGQRLLHWNAVMETRAGEPLGGLACMDGQDKERRLQPDALGQCRAAIEVQTRGQDLGGCRLPERNRQQAPQQDDKTGATAQQRCTHAVPLEPRGCQEGNTCPGQMAGEPIYSYHTCVCLNDR